MTEKLIRDLVDQAKDHDSYLLTAGLAVLSKEVNEYLVENPREDATMFSKVFSSTREPTSATLATHPDR